MKKIIQLITIGILFLCSFSSVQGEEKTTVSLTPPSGNTKDVVEVQVNITPGSGFTTGKFIVTFDEGVLQYQGYTLGEAGAVHDINTEDYLEVSSGAASQGELIFAYITKSPFNEGGSLLNFKFKVKAPGEGGFQLLVPELINQDGNKIETDLTVSPENPIVPSSETPMEENKNNIALEPGKTMEMLTLSDFQGLNLQNPIIWTVSNPQIAKIDDKGNLTALASGKIIVTGTQGNTGVSTEIEVTGNEFTYLDEDIEDVKGKTLLGDTSPIQKTIITLGFIVILLLLGIILRKRGKKR